MRAFPVWILTAEALVVALAALAFFLTRDAMLLVAGGVIILVLSAVAIAIHVSNARKRGSGPT